MTTKYLNVKFNIDTAETGKRLREIRKKNHNTIMELSEKTGLSKAMISETEAGKNKPSPNLMLALIKLYNVNINWVLTGEGEPYQKEEPKKAGIEGEFTDLYYDLLWHLENTPVVRYAVMGFYSEYMHRYKDRIIKTGQESEQE
jgi:transcriptional regulator with XRE-family HTH domain